MSKLSAIKFIFVAVLIFLPAVAEGQTLVWEDKTWDVKPVFGGEIEDAYIRNNFLTKNSIKSVVFNTQLNQTTKKLDETTLTTLTQISAEVNQTTQNAKLMVRNNRAEEFNPGQAGQMLDLYELINILGNGTNRLQLPMVVSHPETKLADTNNLGITELVAVGESDFTGSPYNRTVNIRVGADKFNGLIISPGQEFSFNEYLGDVDAENGFLPELVIKRTGTVPEFGGGLCQVSSTAFRAAMNAGLPITARRNHSYAVKYYAPQGTDATIYPGVQDLKFVNDLPSHILIRTRIEGTKLFYDFYGTKDDRKITFDGPYQYDQQSNGAMKAVWTRWVEQGGEKKEQVFYSNYQPPALFQVQPQASTPNPESAGENENSNPDENSNQDEPEDEPLTDEDEE